MHLIYWSRSPLFRQNSAFVLGHVTFEILWGIMHKPCGYKTSINCFHHSSSHLLPSKPYDYNLFLYDKILVYIMWISKSYWGFCMNHVKIKCQYINCFLSYVCRLYVCMYFNEKQPDDSQAIFISINKLIEGASFIKRCLLCKGFKYVLTILQFSRGKSENK